PDRSIFRASRTQTVSPWSRRALEVDICQSEPCRPATCQPEEAPEAAAPCEAGRRRRQRSAWPRRQPAQLASSASCRPPQSLQHNSVRAESARSNGKMPEQRQSHNEKGGPVVRFPDYLLHKEHIAQSRRQLFANAAIAASLERMNTRQKPRKFPFVHKRGRAARRNIPPGKRTPPYVFDRIRRFGCRKIPKIGKGRDAVTIPLHPGGGFIWRPPSKFFGNYLSGNIPLK